MMSLSRRNRTFAQLVASAAAVFLGQNLQAANFLWNAATPGANNWSDSFNWNPTGVPGLADTAIFGATGTSPDSATINNIVNTSTTVANLSYTNTVNGSWHVTQISAPNKLTVTNNFTVGGLSADNLFTSVAMVGDGTFEADGNNFKVGNAGSANSPLNSTLDLSGLSNFVYKAQNGTWIVGGSAADARAVGTLTLAGLSNNITVNTLYVNVGSGNNSTVTTLMQFSGGTNILNVGTFMVCSNKAQFATVQFLNTAPAEAGLRIRGTNGNADDASRANIILGERNNTGSANTVGKMLLNGHPVDIKANLLLIGDDRSGSTAATHGGIGVLQFDTGVVDASSIVMASCTSSDTQAPSASGSLTVGANGKLIVGNGGISMANQARGGAIGELIISGTAVVSNNIFKATLAGTNNISLTGGSLTMVAGTIGTPAIPADNLNLTSASLTFAVSGTTTNAVVSNFNPVDDANIINISSLPILSGYPSQFPLIAYANLMGAGSISIGTLPGTFKGYITNDTSVNTVFLVVTNGPATSKLDQWTGSVNSTWDTSTLNWTSSGLGATYAENDTVAFDDSAVSTNVNYSTTHTPLDLNFSNNSLAYLLGGTGKISGPASLTMSGGGSVTLNASGGDNFTGGIAVNGGTVILDDANSAITGPATIAVGATLQIGNNDSNGNVPSSIATDGALIFNRANSISVNFPISGNGSLTKLGNGVLTLSNTNTYLGDTTVSQGTLALAGAGSVVSQNMNVNNATLNLSGLTSGNATLVNLNLTGSTLTLGASNGLAPLSASFIAFNGSANTINVSALPGIATYPSTVTLIRTTSGIVGTVPTLGSLPSANPPYQGTIVISPDTLTVQLTLTSGPVGTRPFVAWTGADAPNGNTNWSDASNWDLPGAPGAQDNVVFNSTAVVSDALTVDNIVDANTTVSTLRYTNAVNGQWHVTQIPNNVTLNVSSNLTVGGLSGDGLASLAAMTGGGTLNVGGTSLTIGNNGTSSTSSGTLDLSGLSNFVYSVPTGTITMSTGARSIATFKLAGGSNYITANSFNDNIASTSTSGNGSVSLGSGTNIINVASFNISAGRSSSTVSFPNATGGLRIRGVAGTDSSRAAMTIGNRNNGGGSGNSITGNLSLNGHPVDIKLSTLTLGQSGSNPSGTANGNGILSFDTGIIDVNSIVLATATGTTVGVQASGIINVGTGGTLLVGTGGINLGNRTGASGSSTGTLNIGGTLSSSGNIVETTNTVTSTITVTNGGTLKMLSGVVGTPAAPIDTLNIDTATLQLNINGSTPVTNIVATTINAQNTTTISIGSVSGISPPATVSLISYAAGSSADPFPNLALSLPSGMTATLVDNQANGTIDLNITALPVSVPPSIGTITISGGNIIISGTNNLGAGGTYHVLSSTNLSLPLANWTVLTNGTFDGNGNFSITNAVDSTKPIGFYLLQVP